MSRAGEREEAPIAMWYNEIAMKLDPRQIEVMDDATAMAMRRKTPAERLAIAFDLWEYAREHVEAAVRWQHPEWNDQLVLKEIARRMLHEST